MKELNISEELFSRFLDGRTSEEENEQILQLLAENHELMDEFTAIAKASQLADHEPLRKPNLEVAAQSIRSVLPESQADKPNVSTKRRRSIRIFTMAAAAVAAILLASTIYLLLRSTNPQNTLVQDNKSETDSTLIQPKVEQTYIAQNETPESVISEATSSTVENETSTAATPPTETPSSTLSNEYLSVQVEERHYASTQETNSLSITKPNKSNYLVLCKNLDKTFVFEWNASNVQKLHFSVKDASNKVIVEVTDTDTKRYELSYRKIYPEKQLTWKLAVTYKDGSKDEQSGQINIDYNINKQ
ncbi:MAG: hypothetical protein IKO62_02790 [Bacteroidales bacterium]|nr:hypothetical protein [Bacteroidales bacterium]